MIDVIFPRLDQGMTAGVLVEWLADVGDRVTKGQALFQIETDKIVTDMESPASGTITEILVQAGVEVAVGTVIATMDGG